MCTLVYVQQFIHLLNRRCPMGAHSSTKTPTPKSPSSTGGFGWKFLVLVVVAAVVAWYVTR